MSKYRCSYAYDIPCYYDFTGTAPSQTEARKLIESALEAGTFSDTVAEPDYNSTGNDRVFVTSRCEKPEDAYPTVLVRHSTGALRGQFTLVES